MADALELAKSCARHADDIQAEDILVIDLRGLSSITDFFVICTGSSTPHLKAIRREVSQNVEKELGEKPRTVEGDPESQWLVLDFFDVIVHIFHKDKRSLYALENLWKDAPRLPLDFLSESGANSASASGESREA